MSFSRGVEGGKRQGRAGGGGGRQEEAGNWRDGGKEHLGKVTEMKKKKKKTLPHIISLQRTPTLYPLSSFLFP